VRERDGPVGFHHKRARKLGGVTLRNARKRPVAGCPEPSSDQLRANDLFRTTALEADRAVALTVRVTETVEWDAALPAEVKGRLGPILEDRDHVGAGLPEFLVGLTQLGEVLPAERSPKMTHEGHDERAVAPALRKRHFSVARLDSQVRERVADGQSHLSLP
jgi:hypothetical protein